MSTDTSPQQSLDSTPALSSKSENSFVEIIRFSLIALLIVLPIRWFVAQPFIVSGASMEDTFFNNEYLIVDQFSYHFHEPERGEVIIFRYPKDHTKYFIKRVIGLPGDTLTIDGHRVTIINSEHPDGLALDETYIGNTINNGYMTISLGDDEYFVMGDNRDHSSDSRIWGVLHRNEIIGRAFLRLFPLDRTAIFPGYKDLNATSW